MATETTIPLLPCASLETTLIFYRALGFEVTYEQAEPYVYGAVRRGGIDLHFHHSGRPEWKDKPGGTCLVMVPDVGAYHRTFGDGLRARYGRVPTAGHPRITRLRKGQTRFTVFDPTGNSLTFIQQDEPEIDYTKYDAARSRLGQVLDKGAFLRDTYLDDRAAASVLDKALAGGAAGEPVERALALAARAELAVAMGDEGRGREVRAELAGITLGDEDRERHRDDLRAADELEKWIHGTV
jgi:hypothetical protein